jgi:general secretion pathway protein H
MHKGATARTKTSPIGEGSLRDTLTPGWPAVIASGAKQSTGESSGRNSGSPRPLARPRDDGLFELSGGPNRIGRNAGFTLLELLVVLLLLAVLAGFAGTRIAGSMERSALDAASSALVTDLRRARSLAIVHNVPVAVRVDVGVPSFGIPGSRTFKVSDRLKVTLFTAVSDQTTTNVGEIRFFSDGSSTGGEVTFAGDDAREYVQIDWFTGRVAVYEEATR